MGRKAIIVKDTKLRNIMEKKGMTRKDLLEEINNKNPENQISPDALSRIVNGSRTDFKLSTLYRICNALKLSPNVILNWEEEMGSEYRSQLETNRKRIQDRRSGGIVDEEE